MKTVDGPSKRKRLRILYLMILSFILLTCFNVYHDLSTYHSIKVIPNDSAKVEINSEDYDINKLIKKIDGEIVSIKQDVDTSVLGEQEVVLEVKKENMVKDIPMTVSVVDSVAPVIELKEEKITITKGDSYNLQDNIQSVMDQIDGDIAYQDDANQSKLKTYNISMNGDFDSVGDHEVKILAIDNSGNIASQTFTLEVVEPEPEPVYNPVYYDLPANANSGDLVSIAYSLVGAPYVSGGTSPSGFDCSGFVQYVYSRVGVWVSRSTSTQLYDGYPVSYDSMQPGDIIVWGYGDGNASHSSLYVGDGMMVHATNPSTGVIASSVSHWINSSGTSILSIRRIQ